MPEHLACPWCGYRTLPEGPGADEVCPVRTRAPRPHEARDPDWKPWERTEE